MTTVKLAQFGLGPIGIETLRLAARKPWAEVVGGVDIDPAKAGKTLGEVAGLEGPAAGRRVYPSFEALWSEHQPQVVFHTAGSKAAGAIAQITPMARAGVSVVSSCEELLYPNLRAPAEARELDELCRAHGSRVVGGGVNPGFVLDLLPVCLSGVCREVRRVYGERVVNASTRRMPLQRKIGSGMDPEQFRSLFRQGKMGHAGFQESASLIAHCMGWKIEQLRETCEPVVARQLIRTDHFEVQPGQTCGLHQRVEGTVGGQMRIELDLKMYLDAPDPHDLVRIEGDPPVEAMLSGGVAGDVATVASLVNAAPRVLSAPPGLRLMTELSVPSVV